MNLLKNNWKKIAFGSPILTYGIYSLKSYYDITKHMTTVAHEICDVEKSIVSKKVLVVLNPVANKKGAEKTFKKYCEPILHLAGYSVDIVKTTQIGHAKSIIETLKILPDAIVIAGGDGTTSEVVTGLLRRSDKACPIVLLPLGHESKSALKYHNHIPSNKYELVKVLSDSLLNMIKENVKSENVIKYDVISNIPAANEETQNRSIYGLGRFSWGLLRDIDSVKDKYWVFGSLRHYAATIFNLYSTQLNWKINTNYLYTPPCSGCQNCYIKKEVKLPKTYITRFLSSPKTENSKLYTHVNENCKTELKGQAETSEIDIECNQNEDHVVGLRTTFSSCLSPGINILNKLFEITEGQLESTNTLTSRTITLLPELREDDQYCYSIDGEEYDARDIMLTAIPNAINIFACIRNHNII